MKGQEMIVNEMKLVAQLGDVESLPEETFEQARVVLQAAVALEGDPRVVEISSHTRRRRRSVGVRSGVVVGLAAAVAALAIIGTSPVQTTKVPSASNHSSTLLIRLAADVSTSPTPIGNAEVVARTTNGGGQSVTVYDLYADNGEYFFSQTASGLAGQVSSDNNQAGGLFAREIAAAKLAATGDVQTAAQNMADAANPNNVVSPTQTASSAADAAAKAAATGQAQGGNLYDNYVWENSQDAIIASSGEPQVRAGVLQILATLPGVTVTSSTSGGQPTLVLSAGTPELGSGYGEQLTINATTGIPMSFASGTPGQAPSGTISYQVSRVTTSDIAAGK
jgi:hypothetical protein